MSIGGIYATLIFIVYILNACGSDNVHANSAPMLSSNMPTESSPVVSAVLLECPKEYRKNTCKPPANQPNPRPQCEQQLMVNIRVNPSFHIEKIEKFLILDEVYDPRKRSKAKIMSPYLIEISRGEPIMMYPLEFTKQVKADGFKNSDENDNNKEYAHECNTCNKNKNKNEKPNPCPKPDPTTCKNGNADIRTEMKQPQNLNMKNLEKPEQESLNRVLNKITSAFGSVTKIKPSPDQSQLSQYKIPQSETEETEHDQTANAATITNNDYDAEEGDDEEEWDQHRRAQDTGKRRELAADNSDGSNGHLEIEEQKIENAIQLNSNSKSKRHIGERCQHETVANVGVDEKLLKTFEKRGKLAQIGLVRTKPNVKLTELADDGDWSGNVKIRDLNTGGVYADMIKNNKDDTSYNEKELNQNQDFVDYSSEPSLQHTDLGQAEEYNDMKTAIHPITKRKRYGKRKKLKNKLRGRIRDGSLESANDEEEYGEVRDGKQVQNTNRDKTYKSSSPRTVSKTTSLVGRQMYTDMGQGEENNNDAAFLQIQKEQKVQTNPVDADENLNVENSQAYQIQSDTPLNQPDINSDREEETNFLNSMNNNGGQINDATSLNNDFPDHVNADVHLEPKRSDFYNKNSYNNNDNNYNGRPNPLNSVEYDYDDEGNIIRYIPQKNRVLNGNSNNNNNNKGAYVQQNRVPNGRGRIYENRGNNPPYGPPNDDTPNRVDQCGNMENRYEVQNTDESYMPMNMRKNNDYMNNNNNNEEPQQESDAAENVMNEPNQENYRKILPPNANNRHHQSAPNVVYTNNDDDNEPASKPGSSENFDMKNNADNWHNDHRAEANILPSTNRYYGSATHSGPKKIYGSSSVKDLVKFHYNVELPSPVDYEKNKNNFYIPFKYVHPSYAPKTKSPEKSYGFKSLWNLPRLEQTNLPDDTSSFVPSKRQYTHSRATNVPAGVQRSPMNTKKKRSFIFYDDLEMHDTLMDNDYNSDQGQQTNAPMHGNDDISPCDTCGKGKKPPGKSDQTGQVNVEDHTCGCRNQPKATECNCVESKDVRSVSDAWYSVFNMSAPLPFLTTKLNIFRKRHNTWWKIVPSITLSSLSGIFANANLSILFSSHVDIFQLEKSLRLQNHQLLIPKDERPTRQNQNSVQATHKHSRRQNNKTLIRNLVPNLNILNKHPEKILAVRSSTFDWKKYKRADKKNYDRSTAESNDKAGVDMNVGNHHATEVYTIGDLGYFPTSMNLLEYCPNDKNRLCLNMLEERAPAYSIRVKMPFRENGLIQPHVFKLKIARIITDATTKDVLQLSVDVINKGLMPHAFSISVNNCPETCASKTSVKKFLVPNYGETVTFLLPLILDASNRHKKFQCDLVVKSPERNTFFDSASGDIARLKRSAANVTEPKEIVVAMRSFKVDPDHRCFCVWDCSCHCVPKLESYINYKVCQKMSHKEQKYAGLLLNCKLDEQGEEKCILDDDENDNDDINKEEKTIAETVPPVQNEILQEEQNLICVFLYYTFILLGLMLILGLIKACLGLCSRGIDKFGYSYVQPRRSYENATKFRRFMVNTAFFIMFPFLFWCTCFRPSEEDLLCASTEWQCSVAQDGHSDDDNDGYGRGHSKDSRTTEDDEEIILTQHLDRDSERFCHPRGRLTGGQEADLNNRYSDWALAFNESVFDDDDDADEEANTKFVLQALVESRESLKKLLLNRSGHMENAVPEEEDARLEEATALVNALKAAQIVYRTFDQPIGNVRKIPTGVRYCLQGYFLPSLGTEYEFVNYNPLAQHRCFSANGKIIEVVRPPIILCPKEFSRIYANKIAVLEAGDLTIQPPPGAPCINVSTMAFVASSVAKLASDQSFHGCTPQYPLSIKDNTNSTTSSSSQQQQYRLDRASTDQTRSMQQHPAYNMSILQDVAEEQSLEDKSNKSELLVENVILESMSVQRITESFPNDSQSSSL